LESLPFFNWSRNGTLALRVEKALPCLEFGSLPIDGLWNFALYERMPKIPINDLKHWRERAEEAGTVADELTALDSKRAMLRIAEDYEELARRAERRLKAAGTNSN
jgi:hypothetical protein